MPEIIYVHACALFTAQPRMLFYHPHKKDFEPSPHTEPRASVPVPLTNTEQNRGFRPVLLNTAQPLNTQLSPQTSYKLPERKQVSQPQNMESVEHTIRRNSIGSGSFKHVTDDARHLQLPSVKALLKGPFAAIPPRHVPADFKPLRKINIEPLHPRVNLKCVPPDVQFKMVMNSGRERRKSWDRQKRASLRPSTRVHL